MARTIDFGAQINRWVRQTQERQNAVFRESIQRLIDYMQKPVGAGGNMPVVTGFLRASLRVTLGRSDYQTIAAKGMTSVKYDESVITAVLINATIGDVISVRYLANYAWRIEEGFVGIDAAGRNYNQPGRGFVKLAAQRWPTIVRQVSAEAKRGAKP